MRLYHLITTLETGGAEVFLYRLVKGLQALGHECRVGALVRSAPVGDWLRDIGVEVDFLDMKAGRPGPLALARFLRIQRGYKPDLLQTWMYHADLLGLFALLVGQKNILWNVRCTDMDLKHYNPVTALTVRTCAKLSRLPRGVLTNAHAAKEFHEKLGYRPKKFIVIPNGYDTAALRPDPEARTALRRELSVAEDQVLVGLAARFDPMKGHLVFARAAGEALKQAPSLRFALYGAGVDADNTPLITALRESGALPFCRLLGRRDDAPRVHAALDIAVSSSLFGEGFSNTMAESMACGVPCVGTDVGDTRRIIGDTGQVVPPNDAPALAKAVLTLAEMRPEARQALGQAARRRVEKHFSLEKVVAEYAELYDEIVK